MAMMHLLLECSPDSIIAEYRLLHSLALLPSKNRVVQRHPLNLGPSILPTHNRRVQAKLQRVLAARGLSVHEGCRVVEVHKDGLRCADGREYELEEILWVTDAAAPAWLAEAGLAVDERGFVLVHAALQSVSHADVFAAG